MLDIFALTGLEWLYDHLERRYGRRVAWLVTSVVALALVAMLVCVLVLVLSR